MGIEDIKRWHWVVIAVIVGFGMGWVWSGAEPGNDGRLINQFDFERELTRSHPKTKEPLIKNIVIEPATTDYRSKMVQPVSFLRLQQGSRTGKTYYMPAQFIASVPYTPTFNAPSPLPTNYKVQDYLASVTKQNPQLGYHYGWWNERPAALTLWTLGSVVIIGGIWPTLLSLMVGAGLGGIREKKAKKEDYFDRFSHAPEPEKARPALAVTDADRDRLEAMNEVLERDLADAAVVISNTSAVTTTSAEVRKLEGGPLETAPAIKSPDADDEIEVKGEYYPVLIHHKKHHEDEHDAKQK